MINEQFDTEFKFYLYSKGINIDPNLFDVKFNPPQNFAAHRQAEMDQARVSTFGSVSEIPYLSKRFALKRFLGLTAEEIAENEQMWREENVDTETPLNAQGEMRSAGITTSGLGSDMASLGQSDAGTEELQNIGSEAAGGSPLGGQPASGGAPPPPSGGAAPPA